MTPFASIIMIFWPLISIYTFKKYSPQKASIICIIGGILLLPVTTIEIPGVPLYNKFVAVSLGLILGELSSGSIKEYPLRGSFFDIPMGIYCFVVPVATSLSNGLGLYDGLSEAYRNFFQIGVFYWIGRRYFTGRDSIRDITMGIVYGGILYIPLTLYEIRMSPQLSNMIYGIFPHSFLQHVRYGGYRPIVFMNHGLMVALWMAVAFMFTFWLWRQKQIVKINRVPMALIVAVLFIDVILCKSANGWVYALLSIVSYFYFSISSKPSRFRIFLVIVYSYLILRITNTVTIEFVQSIAETFFDTERVASLLWRLRQEDLFSARALLRPILGWGGYNRGWPVNPVTGEQLIQMVDSLWVITFSTNGLLGLFSLFVGLGLGPWFALGLPNQESLPGQPHTKNLTIDIIVLSLTVSFFLIDSLLNAMMNPIYVFCSGALASKYVTEQSYNKSSNAAV